MTAIEIDQTYRPWLDAYPSDIAWDTPIDATPVHEQVLSSCDRLGSAVALDFLGATTSYSALGRRIRALAAGLQARLGVKKGTRVALLMPNTPDFVATYFAVLMAGGTVVNCNPLYSNSELQHILENSGTDIVVTLDLKVVFDKAEELARRKLFSKLVVCKFSRALSFPKNFLFGLARRSDIADVRGSSAAGLVHWLHDIEGSGEAFNPVSIDRDKDIAVQQYTGGTTGEPKGALLTHANIAANVGQVRLWWGVVFQPGNSLIVVLPFFHIFAMTVCMNAPLISGVRINMLPRYEEKAFFDLVDRVKPNVLVAVPTLCLAVANAKRAAKSDLNCIEVTVSGGAALSEETRRAFAKVTRSKLKEGYGLTECSPVVACTYFYAEDRHGSIGQPIPGTDVRLLDVEDPTRQVAPGERGELAVRGPQVMAGYHDNPDATATAFADGYLRTGDVGYFDEDGYIFLVDRIKDLIICSGFNVYPRAIEDALYRHDAVEECNVIGVPDAYRGEAPVAYVKLKEGQTASQSELMGFLREHLSKMEMPREILFRDQLPKTMIGKLSKKELREDYERHVAQGKPEDEPA